MGCYCRFIGMLAGFVFLCTLAACTTTTPVTKEVTAEPPADIAAEQPREELLSNNHDATVIKVISGDTIEADIAGAIYTIRYIGMNIPQSFQANKPVEYFQNKATKKNRELVEGRTVCIEKDVQDKDREGNLLRYVWLDTLMVNAELIRHGYMQAICCAPNTRYEDILFELEREAQSQGRGLWVVNADTGITGAFIGSRRSLVYHYPSCILVGNISGNNREYFVLPADAAAKGYIPCRVCNPPAHSCSAGACSSN